VYTFFPFFVGLLLLLLFLALARAYVMGAAKFGRERTFYGSKLSHLLSLLRSAEPAAGGLSLDTMLFVGLY